MFPLLRNYIFKLFVHFPTGLFLLLIWKIFLIILNIHYYINICCIANFFQLVICFYSLFLSLDVQKFFEINYTYFIHGLHILLLFIWGQFVWVLFDKAKALIFCLIYEANISMVLWMTFFSVLNISNINKTNRTLMCLSFDFNNNSWKIVLSMPLISSCCHIVLNHIPHIISFHPSIYQYVSKREVIF